MVVILWSAITAWWWRGWGGTLNMALAVFQVMHELERVLVVLNHSAPLELRCLNSLSQNRLTPRYAIKASSTMFSFSFYSVIALITLFKVRSRIVTSCTCLSYAFWPVNQWGREELLGRKWGEKADEKTMKEGKQEKGDNSTGKVCAFWNGEWV